MSIGFTFTGRVKKPEGLISAAKKLADERYYGLYQQEDGLSISLCPLDGRVYITWKKESGLFGQWTVEGECCSTPAGPGLHKAAVEALDALAPPPEAIGLFDCITCNTPYITRAEMEQGLETAIHQFAKRQMTWFRGMERRGFKIEWLPYDMPDDEFSDRVKELC